MHYILFTYLYHAMKPLCFIVLPYLADRHFFGYKQSDTLAVSIRSYVYRPLYAVVADNTAVSRDGQAAVLQ